MRVDGVGAEQRLQARRMIGDERVTSRAHWALVGVDEQHVAFEPDRRGALDAGPTAARQANSTLPGDSGASRSSSASAPGIAWLNGQHRVIIG